MSKQREQFFLYIDGEAISVTEEVYETFWHYTNKEDYFMRQLKRVRRVRDRKEEKWVYVPARERSLEEFLESQESTKFLSEEFESSILSGFWFESVLETLTEEEKEIVREFYINGKTERAACAVLGIPRTTFQYREKNLRKKLGILLNDFL